MTAYHGGKQRIGKYIAEEIYESTLDIIEDEGINIVGYCEPFCGMLGVYQHIPDYFGNKVKYLAGDMNASVIKMWQQAQKGWKPPTKKISKTKFYNLKYDGKVSAEKGFIGHVQSFRSIYFNNYATHITKTRLATSSKKVTDIAKKLKKVKFKFGPYTQFSNLKGYVIYCDPPYKNTPQYFYNEKRVRIDFDYRQFVLWCIEMSEHNIVFVSEYMKPGKQFYKVWSKGKEKLYVV